MKHIWYYYYICLFKASKYIFRITQIKFIVGNKYFVLIRRLSEIDQIVSLFSIRWGWGLKLITGYTIVRLILYFIELLDNYQMLFKFLFCHDEYQSILKINGT